MIGTKFVKGSIDWAEYTEAALWCNKNGAAIIEYDDYYEVVNQADALAVIGGAETEESTEDTVVTTSSKTNTLSL